MSCDAFNNQITAHCFRLHVINEQSLVMM